MPPKRAASANATTRAASSPAKKASAGAAIDLTLPDLEELWPAGARSAAQRSVAAWYTAHKRALPWRVDIVEKPQRSVEQGVTPYAIWVSEIMSQQTQIDRVVPYWRNWLEKFPTPAALAAADLDTVRTAWAGLGFYRRAAMLHRGAQFVVDQHKGVMPRTIPELLEIPGVGPYTAAAIGSVCFGIEVPAVDGNVQRVTARLAGRKAWDVKRPASLRQNTADAQWLMKHAARGGATVPSASTTTRLTPGDWNQAMMELGATVCRPNGAPLCAACPFQKQCTAKQLLDAKAIPTIEGVIPLHSVATARREMHAVSLLVLSREDGGVLLEKRPDNNGLLAGLWEVPFEEVATAAAAAGPAVAALKKRTHVTPAVARAVDADAVRHLFSHIDFNTRVFVVRVPGRFALPASAQGTLRWHDVAQLGDHPLSNLCAKVLKAGLKRAATLSL